LPSFACVPLPDDLPETRYAKSGDIHIAYQVSGSGPPDTVVVPGLFAGIDTFYAENAKYHQFRRRIESFGRLIIFDKRGTGSSDRVRGAPSLEERMDDLRAVMDEVGSSAAAIYGMADGGSMSLLFAATYPQRAFALALFHPKVRYVRAADFPWAPTRAEYERETAEMLASWGSSDELRVFARSEQMISPDVRLQAARALRMSASPGAVSAVRNMNTDIDLRSVLSAVHVPTLVMYRSAVTPDSRQTYDIPNAQYIAEHVPRGRLAAVEWENWLQVRMVDDFIRDAWAERQRTAAEPQRVLATVLFTDIVGSTQKAAELGPRWQDLLREHNALVRRELQRFNGREIDTAGDGFFASGFDGPARAIRCACAIRDAVSSLGLGIRLGIHTGECDIVDGKLSGLAVNIGSRVAGQAEESEVMVSGTVKDLVAGSGIEFDARGVRNLKGLGEWPLYAVTGE
jgi:class 3 adenylate cyclase/pimeloyl-ACP methyl ester carboxylesterase